MTYDGDPCDPCAENPNPVWASRDGREIPLSELFPHHIEAIRAKVAEWLKAEQDPDLRKDLKAWHRRFGAELRTRQAADRKAQAARGDGNHVTREGEVMRFDDMDLQHLWALRKNYKNWLATERDPDKRQDLERSLTAIMAAIRHKTPSYSTRRRRARSVA
jgi:hypothetical protein